MFIFEPHWYQLVPKRNMKKFIKILYHLVPCGTMKQLNLKFKDEEWYKLENLARKENLTPYKLVKGLVLELIGAKKRVEVSKKDVATISEKIADLEAKIATINTRLSRLERVVLRSIGTKYFLDESVREGLKREE